MRQTLRSRTMHTVAATLATLVLAGCGTPPLANVGERSGDWIGSLTNGATFLPSERHLETVMATP